jgi:hypothetical protein
MTEGVNSGFPGAPAALDNASRSRAAPAARPAERLTDLALPLARYRLTARFSSELRLPDYAGSLLRGVFGAALRRSACMTGLPDCRSCSLWRTCPYPALFETPPRQTQLAQRFSQVPNPYVIEPPAAGLRRLPAGEPLAWHLLLFGADALRQLPLVVHAWQRSLRHGWGPDGTRAQGELLAVEAVAAEGRAEPAWDGAAGRVLPHDATWHLPPTEPCRALTLHLHTPLRLQQEGRALGVRELSPRVLVAHLLRRVRLVLELHLGVPAPPFDLPALLALADTLRDDRSGLRWHDWVRYSSRQQQEMTLGGVVGPWRLEGDLGPLLPWLQLGQWLHLGKNATMGLGGYGVASEIATLLPDPPASCSHPTNPGAPPREAPAPGASTPLQSSSRP